MTLLAVAVSLLLSTFFSGMETAVLLINRARVRHLKEQGSFGARILLGFLRHPGKLSSTVLIGNTLANTVGIVLVICTVFHEVGLFAAIVSGFVFGFILWWVGDLIPKSLFRRYPNRLSVYLAPLLFVSEWVFFPLAYGFDLISRFLVPGERGPASTQSMFVTREELKLLAREARSELRLSAEQRHILQSVLDHPRTTVQEVMQPRERVVTLKAEQSEEDRHAIVLAKGFSRYPVESASLMGVRTWEGVWVLYDRIFLKQGQLRNVPLMAAKTRLLDALSKLRMAHSPMGFVQDSEGREVGIVTQEDIIRHYLGNLEL